MFFGFIIYLFGHIKYDTKGDSTYSDLFDAFNFSVQTSEAIGFGELSPHKIAANVIVDINALVSFVNKAIISALIIAKLMMPSRLKNFIKHTKYCVINGESSVLFSRNNRSVNSGNLNHSIDDYDCPNEAPTLA